MNKWILGSILCSSLFSTSVTAEQLPNCKLDFNLRTIGTKSMVLPIALAECFLSNDNVEELKIYVKTHTYDDALLLYKVSTTQETSKKLMKMLVDNPIIREFAIHESPDFSSELEMLVDKKNLSGLYLYESNITAEAFINLGQNQSIKHLKFYEKNIHTNELLKFTENHPLMSLSIEGMQFNHIETQKLYQQNPDLMSLSIYNVKFENIRSLENFTQLESLIFYNSEPLSDEETQLINNLPKLQILGLERQKLSYANVESLSKNTHLKFVSLGSTNIGDKEVALLAQMPHLSYLGLYDNKVSDAGAIALSQHPELRSLDLQNNQVGDAGGIALSTMANLTFLGIADNQLGDATAYAFANKTTDMWALKIWGNHFSNDAILALKSNKHLNVEVEDCDATNGLKANHLVKSKMIGNTFMQLFAKGKNQAK